MKIRLKDIFLWIDTVYIWHARIQNIKSMFHLRDSFTMTVLINVFNCMLSEKMVWICL